MIKRFNLFISAHVELLKYTVLNYIDKFIVFLLPLIVLFLTKDKKIYNDIEYIFSIANLSIIVLEIGRIYLFYGYKIADNRNVFLVKSKNYFLFIQLLYTLIGICIYPFVSTLQSSLGMLYVFVLIRSLYILFLNFFNSYFRLAGAPTRIFCYSIPVNVISIVLICLFLNLKLELTFEMFFLPQCLISLMSVLSFLFRFRWKFTLGLISYIKHGALYAWPIILNVLIVSFVNNYGKIYAYNFLSENEMYNFSYLLRIAMIIQMAHASVLAYCSKDIYMNEKKGLDITVLKLYSLFISIAVILSVTFLVIFNCVFSLEQVKVDIIFVLILTYVLLWCYQAFFEIYYNKTNNNKLVLLYSLIGGSVYLFLLFGIGVKGIKTLSAYMLISVSINFILILLTFFNKIKNYA